LRGVTLFDGITVNINDKALAKTYYLLLTLLAFGGRKSDIKVLELLEYIYKN
jgi:hypothetical protein